MGQDGGEDKRADLRPCQVQSSENIFRRGRLSSNKEGHEGKLGEQVRSELEPWIGKGEQRGRG